MEKVQPQAGLRVETRWPVGDGRGAQEWRGQHLTSGEKGIVPPIEFSSYIKKAAREEIVGKMGLVRDVLEGRIQGSLSCADPNFHLFVIAMGLQGAAKLLNQGKKPEQMIDEMDGNSRKMFLGNFLSNAEHRLMRSGVPLARNPLIPHIVELKDILDIDIEKINAVRDWINKNQPLVKGGIARSEGDPGCCGVRVRIPFFAEDGGLLSGYEPESAVSLLTREIPVELPKYCFFYDLQDLKTIVTPWGA